MSLAELPFALLAEHHPLVAEFVAALALPPAMPGASVGQWLAGLPDEVLFDAGMERGQLLGHLERLVAEVHALADAAEERRLILRAAQRMPDFQHLRPYRFLAARGDGLDRLGQEPADRRLPLSGNAATRRGDDQ